MLFEERPCKDCGAIKEGSYEKGSYCGTCLQKRRKETRVKNAFLKGRKPRAEYGTGRLNLCSKCGKEKDKSFLSSGYCRQCTSERRKTKTLSRRLLSGLQPWGSGLRPTFCYRCKKEKDNPKQGYCNECKRKQDNEWRLRTGRTKKHQTGLCPCGAERAKYHPSYCTSCASKQSVNSAQKRFKREVRFLTRSLIKAGTLIKEPCEVCGTMEKVEAHHDDYTKPMDIRWLCFNHHREHHRNEKLNLRGNKHV